MHKRPGTFPDPPGNRVVGGRRAGRARWLMAAVFTIVEILAIVVVLWQFRADGIARAALAITLAGAFVAVYDSWTR